VTGPGAAPTADDPVTPARHGSRGLRTQQRILDAAIAVLAEHGYERTTIERIAERAGCSRVAFYQYFTDKDDLFRQLAGQVARQLRAAIEAIEPLTPSADGWEAVRAWLRRYGDVYDRYGPVFRAFGAAAETDADLAAGSTRAGERNAALFQSKLWTTDLPPRQLDPMVGLLLATVTRTLDVASILRAAAPGAYSRRRVEDALADVVHRSLFGVDVRADQHDLEPLPVMRISPDLLAVFRRARALEREATEPGRRALASLLAVGHDVIVQRGYHGTRVDDLVAAAGVSHGAFYRYFANKEELVRVVAARSLGTLSTSLAEIPTADRAALRRWLRRYGAAHGAEGALIRVWVELGDLAGDHAAVFDWGRRQVLGLLGGRLTGDPEAEALVLLALVETFGVQDGDVDAAMRLLERGFLVG
jgi:AcrR family transcriptional regulator